MTDAKGAFELGGVPTGAAWLIAFHPVLGYAVVPIRIGEKTSLDVELPLTQPEPDACCEELAKLEAADPLVVGACAASTKLEKRADFLRSAVAELPAACSGAPKN